MAANTTPIFPLSIKTGVGSLIATANTALDGTGTVSTLFTAGSNGSRVDSILIRYTGTSVATVARIYINNGSATSTATNNSLFLEQAIAANTISQTAVSVDYELPLNIALPAGYKITATIGTTVAAGLIFTAFGGDY